MTSASTRPDAGPTVEPIAVVGLACRVPGARDAGEFWRNLADGVESIRTTSLEEQAAIGAPPSLVNNPSFVPVSAVCDDVEWIDAGFFGMSAREAELRDPQHRLFLELAHTALEDAGYDPARYQGEIGVYAGCGEDAYQWRYTRRNRRIYSASGAVAVAVSSHPDYVATYASYKLNLTGPSLTMHTACSTSLVAVHVACEALRGGECDMALAGAASIDLPAGLGYVAVEGGINSPDGHCRAFDARAAGTVWGSGGGVILLKRLSDAIADGDHVRAVVLGNAVNNDGAAKVGFTAPSEQGQAAVVAQALAVADVDPRTISYVEAHGTGTSLGDPIEVAALSSVYRHYCTDAGWCGIGSVKTNIGHLGPAAGVAGVIKTVLSLEHGLIPPSLHYQTPNPGIDFGRNPFYVNTVLSAWERDGGPRRAAVSSFGMGGTNAHLILQEAPPVPPAPAGARPRHVVRLSARTPEALAASAQRLAERLGDGGSGGAAGPDLADVAYTLRTGRRLLPHRLAVVAADAAEAAAALTDPARQITGTTGRTPPTVALLFPGQGAQHPGMGAQIYASEPVFRAAVDECAALAAEDLAGALAEHAWPGADLREVVFGPDWEPGGGGAADPRRRADALRQTAITQPALFVVEYALARLWQSWGLQPAAMAGHSIGEYAAATIAGVFALPDALRLVAERGRLMQGLPAGGMLAVQLSEDEVKQRLPEGLSLAAVNGPRACVVSGPGELIGEFAKRLEGERVGSRRLRTSHAFHSPMMEPILPAFHAAVSAAARQAPRQPFLSNVTGSWITAEEATDPGYWVRQLREPVRFADALAALLSAGDWLLVECGPGQQLCALARLQRGGDRRFTAVPSLAGPDGKRGDADVLHSAAAHAWAAGIELDQGGEGRRVPLPAYPFERTYHYIKPDADAADVGTEPADGPQRELEVPDWFAVPVWRQLPPVTAAGAPLGRTLLFADPADDWLAGALREAGASLATVRPGGEFSWDGGSGYTVRPAVRDDYDKLVAQLGAAGGVPPRIVHAWGLSGGPAAGAAPVWQAQDAGFFSLLSLGQALAATQPAEPVRLDILTNGAADVTGCDLTRPELATVASISGVLPLEMPWLTVRCIDTDVSCPGDGAGRPRRAGVAALVAELRCDPGPELIALRGGRRWHRDFEQLSVAAEEPATSRLREGGVYVITGGLGGVGITIAEDLAARLAPRLVLVARTPLPPREDWDSQLAAPGAPSRAGRAIAAIRRMEATGAQVLVVAADVADPAGARQVREATLARFGEVHAVVHAAGIAGGGMAEVKDRAAAEDVMRPKIAGTLALRDAFAADELDFVVLCSSVTAIAGGFGQIDYCAANNFLDAHACGAHGWNAPVISVNWGTWREVGMAAEVSAPAAFRALQRGERLTPLSHPVLTGMQAEPGSQAWCRGVVSAGSHWVLADHRVCGVPVLPGTAHLEVVRAAMAAAVSPPSPGHVLELRDVVFVDPLAVPDGASAELRVVLAPGADGMDFELVTLAGAQTRTHSRGSAAWVVPPPASPVDVVAVQARCALGERDGGQSASGMLAFGPHWGSLRRVYEGPEEELAWLEASGPAEADRPGWVLHPALLDEATSFGRARGEGRYLPLGYGRITVRGPLPGRLYSHLRHRDTGSPEVLVADITLLDEDGQELVSISDFTLRRVDEQALAATLAVPPAGAAAPSGPPPQQAPPAAAPVAEPKAGLAARGGIAPADGAEAFRLLLTADLGPQVVICAAPIVKVIASVRQVTQETVEEGIATPAAATQRTAGDGYVAPRNELEATVARLWSEALGVEEVSVGDDFFDVGGNSLIAVQLISMLRKEFGVRVPMRSLFEHPTVAGAAAMVADLLKARAQAADGGKGAGGEGAGAGGVDGGRGVDSAGPDGAPAAAPPETPAIRRLARAGEADGGAQQPAGATVIIERKELP